MDLLPRAAFDSQNATTLNSLVNFKTTMKKNLFVLVFSFLLLPFAWTQKNSITGRVLDTDGQGLAFGNVLLQTASDSQLVKLQLSDDSGAFEFAHLPAGQYWVKVSYVGLPDQQTPVFSLADGEQVQLPPLRMQAAANELAEVTVVAQRPLLEVKADRMVFNVEGSINATGSSALELLRKAPGVVVDNNDQVTMMGKTGVRVYINGKKSPLSAEDLAAYLKTLQASDIDHIDIITNPSAKYEAEGSAGIINIQLKKDQRFGSNANLNLGYSVGQREKYNGSLSSNYRNQRINVFGQYSYYDGKEQNFLQLYREQFGLSFDQRSDNRAHWQSHSYKVGMDYSLRPQHTLGFMLDGSHANGRSTQESRTAIGRISKPSIDSLLVADGTDHSVRQNNSFNLNYQYDDGEGTTLNVDTDYGRYRSDVDQNVPNQYRSGDGTQLLRRADFATVMPTDIDILTFKTDYERPLWKGQLGVGAKIAHVHTDNTFNFFEIPDDTRILDAERSNHFAYTEMVSAAYTTYTRAWKAWTFQGGLRVENTDSEGVLTTNDPQQDREVPRTYTDLFPSAGITYQLNPKNAFQLTYSRRINRPNYRDLNPFEGKLDELTFEKGNPFLNPEYANNFQLTHTFNYFLTTSVAYSHTKDLITRITQTQGTTSTFITWLNLAEQRDYSINVSAALPVTKWWNSYTNVNGFLRRNRADYGEGQVIDASIPTFNLYSQHTFQLPRAFSLELSGWYTSPSLWGGNFRMKELYSIDVGMQKKLFDGRANLRVAFSDIFKTNVWQGESTFGALFLDVSGGFDSRRVSVNFSYLLGNNKVKSRRRKTGLDEESQRVGGGE